MTVLVLEGRDRAGGRVHTINYNGMALDLGGSWIHGLFGFGIENPLLRIAKTNNITTVETTYVELFLDSDGTEIESFPLFYEQDVEPLVEYYKTSESDTKELETVLKNFYDTIKWKDAVVTDNPALYWHLMEWVYEQEAIEDIEKLSAENIILDTYFNNDSPSEVIFPFGYNQIVNCLAEELDIRHANVTKVDYTHDPIIVTTEKGDSFKATYVVSTVPLGVLEKEMITFDPPLENKAKSIRNLGMGTMDKVYLVFNSTERFWKDEYSFIHRVTDTKKDEAYPDTWKFFFNLHKYNEEYADKATLLVFHVASPALKQEEKNKDELKREVIQVLEQMYGKQIPEPQIVHTEWAEDQLAWGSYSYISVNGSTADFDRLAEPVGDKLFFAGEATTRCGYGSVHGAYTSGYRAAQEVVLAAGGDADSHGEQLNHGMGSWEIVGAAKPTEDMIPNWCGGTAEAGNGAIGAQ
jgi:monoamine oxidase